MNSRAVVNVTAVGLVLAAAASLILFFAPASVFNSIVLVLFAGGASGCAAVGVLGAVATRRGLAAVTIALSAVAGASVTIGLVAVGARASRQLGSAAFPGFAGSATTWFIVAALAYFIAAAGYGVAGTGQGVSYGARVGLLLLLLIAVIPVFAVLGLAGIALVALARARRVPIVVMPHDEVAEVAAEPATEAEAPGEAASLPAPEPKPDPKAEPDIP